MPAPHKAPKALVRPSLAKFIWERGLDYRAAGEALGRTGEWVRLVCLPFNDPRRRVPETEDMRRIFDWSGGQIAPADFYPEDLRGRVDGELTGIEP